MNDNDFSLPPADAGVSAGGLTETAGASVDDTTQHAPIAHNGADTAGGSDFDFSDADLQGADEGQTAEQQPEEQGEQQKEPGDEYALEFGEASLVPEDLRGDLTGIAKELGVDSKAAVQLLDKSLNAYVARNEAQMKEAGAQLKQEWGDRYAANVRAVKPLMVKVLQKAGIPLEQAGPLKSPMGFRLMNAVREMMGESSALAGASKTEPVLSREQRLQRLYNDPAKMEILANPAHDKWAEVNAEVNKLMGLPS